MSLPGYPIAVMGEGKGWAPAGGVDRVGGRLASNEEGVEGAGGGGGGAVLMWMLVGRGRPPA